MRRLFGFEDDTIFEADDENTGTDITAEAHSQELRGETAPDVDAKALSDIREAIFAHVVGIFNAALPDFLSRSVDPEAQSKLLYDSLDQGLKDYLARVGADADSRCEARWSAEHAGLRSEMEALRHKAEQVERERADIKERQLSADRQKRALSDRLKDLESQVARLEAEREQYDLENKSLLNKLKVVAVQNPGIMEVEADMPAHPTQEEYEALQAENTQLRSAVEQAAERQAIADEMAADMRKRLHVAQREVEDLQAITEQVEKVEQAIAERDEMLARQRENISRLKEQIDTLKASSKAAEERASEREQTLVARVAELEAAASAARAESNAIADEPAPYEEVAPVQKKPRRRKTVREQPVEDAAPKITDADLMDVEAGFADQDWFGAPDPSELAQAADASSADDFGYRAPEPRPRPYDDGMQMSLFD